MIQFNKLYITNDGRKMIIDISVINSSYYTNVYLDNISIDTQDTFVNRFNPSLKTVYKYTISGNNKSVRIEIDSTDLPLNPFNKSFNDFLFFVYVKTKGTPSSSTPCGEDNEYTLGITMNLYNMYKTSMIYMSELAESCNIPKNLINIILRINLLLYAIKAKEYNDAINIWNKYFKNAKYLKSKVKGCGCNDK